MNNAGLIHMDLKPANVLINHKRCTKVEDPKESRSVQWVSQGCLLKIIDFGFTCQHGNVLDFFQKMGLQEPDGGNPIGLQPRNCKGASVSGTGGCLAPEVLQGEDRRLADLFSLGMVLHYVGFGFEPCLMGGENSWTPNGMDKIRTWKESKENKEGKCLFEQHALHKAEQYKDFVSLWRSMTETDHTKRKDHQAL